MDRKSCKTYAYLELPEKKYKQLFPEIYQDLNRFNCFISTYEFHARCEKPRMVEMDIRSMGKQAREFYEKIKEKLDYIEVVHMYDVDTEGLTQGEIKETLTGYMKLARLERRIRDMNFATFQKDI